MADETTPPPKRRRTKKAEPAPEPAATPQMVGATRQSVGVNPLAVTGTGTPPTSPNFGVPRFSSNDTADFPTQANAITDTFDASVAKRGSIVDADIAPNAAIQQTKLALATGMLPNVGDVKMTAAATAPAGWLMCDGSAVPRATYANLYGAIGTAYGAGDGSSTFNLPNLVNRMPIGAGSSYARGAVGGEAAHVLSTGEMPSHAHGINDPPHSHGITVNGAYTGIGLTDGSHAHGFPQQVWASGGGGFTVGGGTAIGVVQASGTAAAASNVSLSDPGHAHGASAAGSATGVSVQNNGSGTPHNNLPPFQALNYVIKF